MVAEPTTLMCASNRPNPRHRPWRARETIPDCDGGRFEAVPSGSLQSGLCEVAPHINLSIACRQGILQGCFAERCAIGRCVWHFIPLSQGVAANSLCTTGRDCGTNGREFPPDGRECLEPRREPAVLVVLHNALRFSSRPESADLRGAASRQLPEADPPSNQRSRRGSS